MPEVSITPKPKEPLVKYQKREENKLGLEKPGKNVKTENTKIFDSEETWRVQRVRLSSDLIDFIYLSGFLGIVCRDNLSVLSLDSEFCL